MRDMLQRFESKPPAVVFEWHDAQTGAEGWVVINSLRGGAAGGGTRMRKGLNKHEVRFLSSLPCKGSSRKECIRRLLWRHFEPWMVDIPDFTTMLRFGTHFIEIASSTCLLVAPLALFVQEELSCPWFCVAIAIVL